MAGRGRFHYVGYIIIVETTMDRTLTFLAIGLVLYVLTCLRQFRKLERAERMEQGGVVSGGDMPHSTQR
jgi:hypothetical protein